MFAEWFRVKGTGKVRREKEHCRDGSGTREVFAEWFGVKGTSKVRRKKGHCRDGSGTSRVPDDLERSGTLILAVQAKLAVSVCCLCGLLFHICSAFRVIRGSCLG